MMNEGEDSGYILNIDACLNDNTTPAVVKGVLRKLSEEQYINVGEVLRDVSDNDLEMLVNFCETIKADGDPDSDHTYSQKEVEAATSSMLMLTMAFVIGEGMEISNENLYGYLGTTVLYTVIESLYRKDLVKVIRENWSITDNSSRPIVQPIVGDGDY